MTMHDLDDLSRRAAALERGSYNELWVLVAETSVLCGLDPPKRRPWLVSVIDEMYIEQDGRCALCSDDLRRTDMEVDHIIPFCYGGRNERTNIQLAHGVCNRTKRAQVDPRDLLRYLESRYMNR